MTHTLATSTAADNLAQPAATEEPPAGTVSRKVAPRKRPTLANVLMLADWLTANATGVRSVCCIRTSDSNARNFASMFDLGTRMRPDDPDFARLREIGVQLVQPAGEALRRRLNVFELRRGSVPGGHGRALLGYCVVIGQTLFILYLETARKADIPGPTADQTRNAFTEALLTVLRAVRPDVLYTPLVSRVFRNMDFAHQVMRTLRDMRITLHAEGQNVPLHGDEGITGLLKSWFSAREADAIVHRLDSIEKNIYVDGDWYLAESFLPFTWRFKGRTETDPMTGESRRIVESKRDLEVVPGSADVLGWFIREGGRRNVTNHDLGVGLGQRGVRSRAPQHASAGYPTLDRINNPANGASSLMAEKWRTAWRSGVYRRSIKLKADLRQALPDLGDRVSEVESPDGSITLFLDVDTPMPAPGGGWGLTEQEWQDFETVRFEPTPQRIGRAASKGGTRRPLASLCSYLDDDAYWELSCRTSGTTYQLLCVPRAAALTEDGEVLVVPSDWPATASLVCHDLHRSVGRAIADAVNGLGDRAAPLQRAGGVAPGPTAEERRATLLADAEATVTRAKNRLKGIRKQTQELDGSPKIDDEERDELRAELKEDEAEARAELTKAKAAVSDLHQSTAPVAPDVARTEKAEADLADLRVAAAALIRTEYTAPVELNEVLARVLRDFRIWTVARGTAVAWSARLLIPLREGGEAEITLSPAKPVPSVLRLRTGAGVANAADPDVLAGLFFEDGLSLPEIGDLRGIDGSGYHKSFLVKQLRTWLQGHGVTTLDMAALDMPPGLRRSLYVGLTGRHGSNRALESWLRDVYRSDMAWDRTWCVDDHGPARRVLGLLHASGRLFTGLPAHEVAHLADLPHKALLALARSSMRRCRGAAEPGPRRAAILGKNFGRQPGPAEMRLVFGVRCPHADCLGRVTGAGPGLLVPLWVPEVCAPPAPDANAETGLICSSCRRTPGNAAVVFPAELLQPWIGGRRRKVSVDDRETYVGSCLDVVPVPVIGLSAA